VGQEKRCAWRMLHGCVGFNLLAQKPQWSRVSQPQVAQCDAAHRLQNTDATKPWSGVEFRVLPNASAIFNASMLINVGDGERLMFWEDPWINGHDYSLQLHRSSSPWCNQGSSSDNRSKGFRNVSESKTSRGSYRSMQWSNSLRSRTRFERCKCLLRATRLPASGSRPDISPPEQHTKPSSMDERRYLGLRRSGTLMLPRSHQGQIPCLVGVAQSLLNH